MKIMKPMKTIRCIILTAGTVLGATGASAVMATELEVTHWWTSGGEAAAVAEFAKAFNATGHTWVDGAIAGSGNTARPIMISRITGGDPMGATQFNHGRQGRGAGRSRADARSERYRRSRGLERHRQPALVAGRLHGRRQDLLRAGQHPFLAVDLVEPQKRSARQVYRCPATGTNSSPLPQHWKRLARYRWQWASNLGSRGALSTC